MLKGDLTATPLAPLLLQLADDESTGCLHISDAEGDEALVFFKTGLVYAVFVPGRRPQLGAKLVSSGALAPEALADALEAQRTELQGWKLGELLVHLGYVDQPVVEAFVKEQVHDALWDLIRWTEGRWKFRKNERAREDVAPPMPVPDLLSNLRERGYEWETISAVVHGPTAVPVLSTSGGGAPETTLDPDAWSMLCKIDGERSVAELARDCGYTMFEAGQVLVALVNAGLVDIEEDVQVGAVAEVEATPSHDDHGLYGGGSLRDAFADNGDVEAAEVAHAEVAEEPDAIAALARLVTEVAASVREPDEVTAEADVAQTTLIAVQDEAPDAPPVQLHGEQSFATSIARVSAALSDVLGPAPVAEDGPTTDLRLKRSRRTPAPKASPESERKRAARAAAAAELAAAHALAEALRQTQLEELPVVEPPVAEVVDLALVRREAEAAAQMEADRLAAEEAARVEAERLAAEEAARVAAEEEAARLEAERLETERLEAERLAAEEAARVAAEQEAARLAAEEEAARLEAERLEAERLAAEEAAAEEAARVAAEQEAARLAAEEAARLEAERLAAEEAARLAAEQEAARLAAEEETARLEAERVAAEEEAARLEAERLEAERLAAEEAARIAAEEAERLEAERVAAEEAARIAAEEEAARLEAERLEAERVAAEEAERLEAERAEAEHVEAERRAAEDDAWAEYWQREADAAEAAGQAAAQGAAAAALLVALAAEPPTPKKPRSKTAEPQPQPEQPDVPAQEAPVEAEILQPAAVGAAAYADRADTAALLRELSSLGVEDEPSPPPPPMHPRPPHRPSPAAEPKKKKRGLFGR
jgi:hypothetical protein